MSLNNSIRNNGRLTDDPKVEMIQPRNGGEAFARLDFTVAVQRPVKRDPGAKDQADFIRWRATGKAAEDIAKWFKKGSGICLEGHIQTGSYQNQEGKTIYTEYKIVEAWSFPVGGNNRQDGESQPQQDQKDEFIAAPADDDENLPFH